MFQIISYEKQSCFGECKSGQNFFATVEAKITWVENNPVYSLSERQTFYTNSCIINN